MRPLLLLRPEPGLTASAARAAALGVTMVRTCPLFEVRPLDWQVPDIDAFDSLLLTSANAVRHAGPKLRSLAGLPVHAVGQATAEAARAAGLAVVSAGDSGVDSLVDGLPPQRFLHLCGADHRAVSGAFAVAVYRSEALDEPALGPLEDLVIAVHSPRAGQRLAELSGGDPRAVIAAISKAAADACGTGWERVEIAVCPEDGALLALAARLCQGLAP